MIPFYKSQKHAKLNNSLRYRGCGIKKIQNSGYLCKGKEGVGLQTRT